MKKLCICLFYAIMYFFIVSEVQAVGSVNLSSSKANVNVGDTFTISINLSGASVASLTSRISIDTQKIEYVSGPSNSNVSSGRVIYTWTDLTGGSSPLTGGTIASFTFKAKSAGTASFGISGDFFSPEETSIKPSFTGVSVRISGGAEGTQNVTTNNVGGSSGNNGNVTNSVSNTTAPVENIIVPGSNTTAPQNNTGSPQTPSERK